MENNKNLICEFCGKNFSKYGIKNHIDIIHTKTRESNRNGGNRNAWNKGKNKETDVRILNYSKSISLSTKGRIGKKHSNETKEKLSKSAFLNKLGSHTSKKSMKYLKKDGSIVYLHSSYETKIAKELDLHNIEWIRPEPKIWFDDNNKQHRYYADFYLINQEIFLDPKNYFLQKKDKRKIELVQKQNNITIIILNENELTWEKINNIICQSGSAATAPVL